MLTQEKLDETAQQFAEVLRKGQIRLVCAESCTGGLIAATLTRIPGISDLFCGSAVVYRFDTKSKWLGVSPEKLANPGPVSPIVAEQMVTGVLEKTPEAQLALSITGDLGPGAPPETDGTAFVGLAFRKEKEPEMEVRTQKITLVDKTEIGPDKLRSLRQQDAVQKVLQLAIDYLSGVTDSTQN